MLKRFSKKQIFKYLTAGVIVASIGVLIHLWFLMQKPSSAPLIQKSFPQIEIDFKTLKSEELQKLLPFNKILPPSKVGREDPFKPYPISTSTATSTATSTSTSTATSTATSTQ